MRARVGCVLQVRAPAARQWGAGIGQAHARQPKVNMRQGVRNPTRGVSVRGSWMEYFWASALRLCAQ